ncbi:MAG: hypothetical protein R3C28_26095 [Pirellulaceae bacterium]
MDTFSISDFRRLAERQAGELITINMNSHSGREESQQDLIRLRNLVDQAVDQLVENGMRASDARDFVLPIRNLGHEYEFWEGRSKGLAVFADQTSVEALRLPISLPEISVVHRRFHLKALLPMLSADEFYVLLLNQDHCRLLRGNEFRIEEVAVPNLPDQIDKALNLDNADLGEQVHSAGRIGKGKQNVVFHGQGGEKDSYKDDLRNTCEWFKPRFRRFCKTARLRYY